MLFCKGMTRVALLVSFELLGFIEPFEGGVESQFPRCKLCSVPTSASIVIGQTLFKIGSMASVELVWILDALEDVSVEHDRE